MEMNPSASSIGAHGRRKFAFGLNAGVALALAALLAGMVNYLSARHYLRSDWSRSGYYALSDKTLALLQGLSNRIDVIAFFQPGHELYEDVDNLLKEYESASDRLRVERVDPDRNLARTEELALRYKVAERNVVVFGNGPRSRVVSADDLSEMDYSAVLQGGEAERTAFKGEMVFSSAIENITQGRTPTVYFLKGHGERDLEERDRRGFSRLKQEVERDNIAIRSLVLGERTDIPPDADALVIAGPRVRFAESEIALLRAHLERDGRLLVLLDSDSDSGLEALLEEWGVGVGRTMVVDPSRTLSGYDLFVRDYRPHAITRNIREETCVFYLPRAVEPLASATNIQDRADKPAVVSLCQSSPESWAEVDRDERPVRFDKGRDFPGPISLAVAAERGPMQELDVSVRPARLVVFGDADFVSNAPLTGGNFDFFLSALNWLLEREDLLAIAPKVVEEARLILDASQLNLLFWALVAGVPGTVATLGVLVWMRRRA
jgi:ABC-type uncharacterized transport system involved in gliding motility auxiliary subunit